MSISSSFVFFTKMLTVLNLSSSRNLFFSLSKISRIVTSLALPNDFWAS